MPEHKRTKPITGGLLLLSLLLLAGCPGGEPKPIDIVLDEDSCAVCRMAVSQQRFASEIVKTDGTAFYFDDIGCLIEMSRNAGVPEGAGVFFVDFNSNLWLDAETAQFLHAKSLPSPMGYGLAAFASRAEAETAAAEWPGKIMGWEQLKQEWQP
jgi:copper chaperone NosL